MRSAPAGRGLAKRPPEGRPPRGALLSARKPWEGPDAHHRRQQRKEASLGRGGELARPLAALRSGRGAAGACQASPGRCCSGWDPPRLPLCVPGRAGERSCLSEEAGGTGAFRFLASGRFRRLCLSSSLVVWRGWDTCSQGDAVSAAVCTV